MGFFPSRKSLGKQPFPKKRGIKRFLMWIAWCQGPRWDRSKRFVQCDLCIAETTFAMRCIFTAICTLIAEIHCNAGRGGSIAPRPMPRCGELSYLSLEQRHFSANKGKTEVRHFGLNTSKTRYTPAKGDRKLPAFPKVAFLKTSQTWYTPEDRGWNEFFRTI